MLGALIIGNNAIDKVADLLSASDFHNEAHRLIYEHINRLAADNTATDTVSLPERLRSIGKLDYVGSLAYIGAIANAAPTAANVRRYAEIVRDRSVIRRRTGVATSIAEAAFNPMGTAGNVAIGKTSFKIAICCLRRPTTDPFQQLHLSEPAAKLISYLTASPYLHEVSRKHRRSQWRQSSRLQQRR